MFFLLCCPWFFQENIKISDKSKEENVPDYCIL